MCRQSRHCSRRTNAITAVKPCSAFFPRLPLFDENQLRKRLRRAYRCFSFQGVTAAALVRLRNRFQILSFFNCPSCKQPVALESYRLLWQVETVPPLRQAVVLIDRQFQVVRLASCRWLLKAIACCGKLKRCRPCGRRSSSLTASFKLSVLQAAGGS